MTAENNSQAGKLGEARPESSLFICTIEAEYPQLIGACMQFISLQSLSSKPGYLLRIVDGDKTENVSIGTLARAAGIPSESIQSHPQNRFLNKWIGLLEDSPSEVESAIVVDWDILNTGASEIPPTHTNRVSARPNPSDLFNVYADRARELAPRLWENSRLLCSINSGLVSGARASMFQLAHQTLEFEKRLREFFPEAPGWQLEKLAASLAAGENGLDPLPPEWNVTPLSDLSDDQVLFWHYSNAHEITRDLKLALDHPDDVYALLQQLRRRWPRQTDRFTGFFDSALKRLRIDELVRPRTRVPRRQNEPLPSKRCLLATCSSGLCNRMLLIAGALRLAKMTNREFLLYWPVNPELGCAFGDLFMNEFSMFTERDVQYLLGTHITVQLYNAWRIKGPHYPDIASDGDPHAEIVLIKGWYYPKLSDEVYDSSFYGSVRPYLQSLRPRADLVEIVDNFGLPEFSIGIHLRRADIFPEFKVSKDEHFQTIMVALVKEYPHLKFFLSTDDPGTGAKFRDIFGDRILEFPKNGGGRTRLDGMREALVDLQLLSRTRAILGNNFSTFSHTAGALSGKPVVVAKEESAILNLPATLAVYRSALSGSASPRR